MTMSKIYTEKERLFSEGSAKFVSLAQNGNLKDLVNYVYEKENPYIDYVPRKERLARNALVFLFNGNHVNAVKEFFTSPFKDDITKLEIDNMISRVINDKPEKIEMLEIVKKNMNFSQDDNWKIILNACHYGYMEVVAKLINDEKIELTQAKKLECFIELLKSDNQDSNFNIVVKFKSLEMIVGHFLYHQQDDMLTAVAVEKKQNEIIHYLIYEKQLRLTKHINMISYGNQEFAKILTKRKLYDSLNQKAKNKVEKEKHTVHKSSHESIHKSIQKMKI